MFVPGEENTTENQAAAANSPAVSSSEAYPFRLLDDEQVMGTYPIARATRPFGSLASFVFVTDSRVIYGAEAKNFTGSSYQSREFSVDSVQGVSISLKRGFDSYSLAFTVGIILNFFFVLIVVAPGIVNFLGPFGSNISGPIAMIALALAVVTVMILRTPEVQIELMTQSQPVDLTHSNEDAKKRLLIVLIFLLLIFVPFLYALWLIGRELGIFTAEDASGFAVPGDVDHLARELGAQVIDVKARGKMAARR
jgi:hypothetical protein